MNKNEKFHQDSDFELNDDALNSVSGGNVSMRDSIGLILCHRCGAFFEGKDSDPITFCPQCLAFLLSQ